MSEGNGTPEEWIGDTLSKLKEYVALRLRLARVEAAEKAARAGAAAVSGLVLMVLAFLVLIFLGVMAGFYFSGVFRNPVYGFGTVAGIYLLLLLLALAFRKGIERSAADGIVRMIFEEEQEEHSTDKQS